ncbi:MAG: hypothetical protein ABI232_02240 [Jatrophihabitantaceae bacterium]
MGYIGQMPQANKELPGRATSTGEPGAPGKTALDVADHGGSRADELPSLLSGSRSVTLTLTDQPVDEVVDE